MSNPDTPPLTLTAHVLDGYQLGLRPAPRERDWMDQTHEHYAYRCLPLNVANNYGWEVTCPSGFWVEWDGGNDRESIKIIPDPGTHAPAVSHFGYGVLTFHIPALFQTNAGVELMVMGPINRPKDGIYAMTGVVETEWSPYTFTMNWKLTRPGRVRFEAGEPFCHLMPLRRDVIENIQPQWKLLSENPELHDQHHLWVKSRHEFLEELPNPDSGAAKEKWQRGYFVGRDMRGCPAPGHRTKLRLKKFERVEPKAPAHGDTKPTSSSAACPGRPASPATHGRIPTGDPNP